MSLDITFDAAPPKDVVSRGRQPKMWENDVAVLRTTYPGQSLVTAIFGDGTTDEIRKAANNRVQSMRNRLNKVQPKEWEVRAWPLSRRVALRKGFTVPGSDAHADDDEWLNAPFVGDGTPLGVYVRYVPESERKGATPIPGPGNGQGSGSSEAKQAA